MVLTAISIGILAQTAVQAPATAEKTADPISTDRPSYSNGSSITPTGRLVFEYGYRQTREGSVTSFDYGDGATLRYGLNSRLEVRLGAPSHLLAVDSGSHVQGWSDTNAGFKWKLSDSKSAWCPSTGVMFTTSLPSGSKDFKEKPLQPEGRLLLSFNPTSADEIDANAIASVPSESGSRYTQFAFSADWTHQLIKDLSASLELYTLDPGSYRGKNAHYVDFSLQKTIGLDWAVDASYGHGLNGSGKDSFFGVGLAHRF